MSGAKNFLDEFNEFIDDSDDFRLAEFLQKNKKKSSVSTFLFADIEPQKYDFNIHVEKIKRNNNKKINEGQNAFIAEELSQFSVQDEQNICESHDRKLRARSAPCSPSKCSPVQYSKMQRRLAVTPSDRLRRYSLRRLSSARRRALLKEFNDTLPDDNCLPLINRTFNVENKHLVNKTFDCKNQERLVEKLQHTDQELVALLKSAFENPKRKSEPTVESRNSTSRGRSYTLEKGVLPGQIILTPTSTPNNDILAEGAVNLLNTPPILNKNNASVFKVDSTKISTYRNQQIPANLNERLISNIKHSSHQTGLSLPYTLQDGKGTTLVINQTFKSGQKQKSTKDHIKIDKNLDKGLIIIKEGENKENIQPNNIKEQPGKSVINNHDTESINGHSSKLRSNKNQKYLYTLDDLTDDEDAHIEPNKSLTPLNLIREQGAIDSHILMDAEAGKCVNKYNSCLPFVNKLNSKSSNFTSNVSHKERRFVKKMESNIHSLNNSEILDLRKQNSTIKVYSSLVHKSTKNKPEKRTEYNVNYGKTLSAHCKSPNNAANGKIIERIAPPLKPFQDSEKLPKKITGNNSNQKVFLVSSNYEDQPNKQQTQSKIRKLQKIENPKELYSRSAVATATERDSLDEGMPLRRSKRQRVPSNNNKSFVQNMFQEVILKQYYNRHKRTHKYTSFMEFCTKTEFECIDMLALKTKARSGRPKKLRLKKEESMSNISHETTPDEIKSAISTTMSQATFIDWLKGSVKLPTTSKTENVFKEMSCSRAESITFTEIHGLDYAFYNWNGLTNIGYLRFKPYQMKPTNCSTNSNLHFIVICGMFDISSGKDTHKVTSGDLVIIKIGKRYSLHNVANEVGVLMLITSK